MPTAAERTGDFSGLLNSAGQQVVIYDPLTKLPFPGNRHPGEPHQPGRGDMIKYLPLPDVNVDNGIEQLQPHLADQQQLRDRDRAEGRAQVHRQGVADRLLPLQPHQRAVPELLRHAPIRTIRTALPTRSTTSWSRRPQVLALNNTWVLNDSSVMSLRFGMTRFPDNNTLSIPFDPATLGFKSNFTSLITVPKFPQVRPHQGYDALAGRTLGAINPTQINWKSTSANAAYSRFFGAHTVKLGGDFRKIGDGQLPARRQLGALLLRQRVHLGERLEQQRDVGQLRRLVPARLSVGELGQHRASSRSRRR